MNEGAHQIRPGERPASPSSTDPDEGTSATMTFQTLPDTADARDVTFSRPTTNPHAAVGVIALWLRSEGLIPNGTPYTVEAARRRVELARELLATFGVDAVTAVERAGRHAVMQAVAA